MNTNGHGKERPIIFANWKMNLLSETAARLGRAIVHDTAALLDGFDLVICPSFIALPRIAAVLARSNVQLGAQDVFWHEKGSYTGEISALELKPLGCRWVIVGHSERRRFLRETDEMVAQKTSAVLRNGLNPVVCVGESREQRCAGRSDLVVQEQVAAVFQCLRPPIQGQRIVIAYEPIWAIHPGDPCAPEQADAMAQVIRQTLIDRYGVRIAQNNFPIIYGGSADASNVRDYLAQPNISGLLIGNASLERERLMATLRAVHPAPVSAQKTKRSRSTKRRSHR